MTVDFVDVNVMTVVFVDMNVIYDGHFCRHESRHMMVVIVDMYVI